MRMCRSKLLLRFVSFAWIALVATPAESSTDLLGGFHPVAGQEGAHALWVNPASVGFGKRPSTLLEFVWHDDGDVELSDPRFYSLVASTDRSSFGFQWELDDVEGVADWTVTWARPSRVAGTWTLGSALQWSGGDDGSLDGTVGVAKRFGRNLRGAATVRHVAQSDVDGVDRSREWQAGLSYRMSSAGTLLTYDWLRAREDVEGDDEHWFGASFDQVRHVKTQFYWNAGGNWSGLARFSVGKVLWGFGYREREGAPSHVTFSLEWREKPLSERPRTR